jgi:hypothetical protein
VIKIPVTILLSILILLNSLLFSLIQGSYELNKSFIIENFCINKDRPELKCDGKCFLAQELKKEKEKQDAQATHRFSLDFGLYLPIGTIPPTFPNLDHTDFQYFSFYGEAFFSCSILGIEVPPEG